MTALAIRSQTDVVPYGSRADVPFGCGTVNAQAVFAGIDRRSGLPSYAVRICNNSQHVVGAQVCFGSFAVASDVRVAPFSIFDTLVAAPPQCANERAIVNVRADGLAFSLDARPTVPRARRPLRVVAALALFVSTSIGVMSAVWAYSGATRVTALAAVAPAPRVVTRTRIVVRHEPLKPLLDELDVTPSAVAAGSDVRVRYGAYGSGTLWLLDEHGRVWAKRAISPAGQMRLTVPESAAGRNLRVVLTAQRGSERAQMSAGILVLPDGANLADLGPQSPPAPDVSPESVASGNAIHVRLPASHGEALVSITDPGGSVIEEIDVAPSQDGATLHAPSVAAPSTYDVVVSIARGHSQDQTVKAITVLP